jgi:hypothetical protein
VSTFTGRGVFIGSWGSSTDLVEVVTHQVAADRTSHVAGWPMSSASTNFLHRHSLSLLMQTRVQELLVQSTQKPAGRSRDLTSRPPLRPTGQWPLHTISSCHVHLWGDTYFIGISNFLMTPIPPSCAQSVGSLPPVVDFPEILSQNFNQRCGREWEGQRPSPLS